jgi:hypothetical protein
MQTCKMTKMVSTSTTCFIVDVKYGSTAKEVKKIITLKMIMKKNYDTTTSNCFRGISTELYI